MTPKARNRIVIKIGGWVLVVKLDQTKSKQIFSQTILTTAELILNLETSVDLVLHLLKITVWLTLT